MESYNAVRCRKECGAEIGYTAKLDWRKVMDYRNMQKDNKFQFVRAEEESGDILGETYGEGNRRRKKRFCKSCCKLFLPKCLEWRKTKYLWTGTRIPWASIL